VSESNASQAANYISMNSASAGRGLARKGALKVRRDSYVGASASGGEVSEGEVPCGGAHAWLRKLVAKMGQAGKLI
jgi:hypothetical protein